MDAVTILINDVAVICRLCTLYILNNGRKALRLLELKKLGSKTWNKNGSLISQTG